MADTTNVTVILDDEKHEFVMDSDKTILDGALENGIDAPHSCQGGICTTCICKVVSG
ncbi:MAG: 2Fe-2S iron-sulfur cluster binding domain-containing protein, partial [Bacteroidota bacterium]|nr:2Fe-2S iron-sulfur cluster binding domain-containing protein [Bacteroidota bacterium]